MTDPLSAAPVDPDLDPAAESAGELPVLAAISAGGVLGALARYQAGLWWPTAAGHFPWTTLAVNVLGCALIGILLVLVTEVLAGRRLVRPFLGTGVLGGFTTFSTYAVDIRRLFAAGQAGLAVSYLVATVLAALLAVTAASRLTRRLVSVARR